MRFTELLSSLEHRGLHVLHDGCRRRAGDGEMPERQDKRIGNAGHSAALDGSHTVAAAFHQFINVA